MEKVWLKRYPAEVAQEVFPEECPTMLELFDKAFVGFKDKTAFINMSAKLSYRELDEKSHDFAAYLQNSGFEQGDAIAIMMPNLLQYPVAMIGILRAGLIVVNVNPNYTARELKHQLNDSNAKAIIILENFACTLEEVVEETSIKQVFTTKIGDMLPKMKGGIVNFTVKYIKKMVPNFKLAQVTSFNYAVKSGSLMSYKRPKIGAENLAFLQYTGGTTGVSKGAMLSHRNIIANLEQISAFVAPLLTVGEDTVVTALPLYHIFALVANCLTFLKFGCTNLLITDPRNMNDFVKELARVKFNAITGVNTLFNGLLNTPKFHQLDFSHLKFGLGGGMAVQHSVAKRWQETTDTVLMEGYGLTECSPVVTCNPHNIDGYTGSIGLPLPSTDVRLVDDNGIIVDLGQPGEMQVKGPQVMQGYYNRPEETAEVINEDGWLSTGDIATVDKQGFFKIVDRKKDMILVSGFNVYPNEIEDVVAELDEVLEVAAVGVSHEVSGEIVKLYIVKSNQDLSADDVIQHCRNNLTAYKIPKLIEFKSELPKSNVGKILRRELRDS
ncbi:MAG: AMP-binding protein [Colwellia sp.]|nr:AMP-binding protein [Colwellia sp.]